MATFEFRRLRPNKPRVDLTPETGSFPLPSAFNGTWSWIKPGSICTDGTTQYVVWVDDNRKARISRRIQNQQWEPSIDLSTVSATALSAQFELDSHNFVVVGVDNHGYVHVSGNHHRVPLKYMRTASPGNLTSWVAGGMVGTEELEVTYPQFIRAKSGNFYFFYRNLTSGDGDNLLNKWNPGNRTWSRVATVFQGSVANVSAYPSGAGIVVNYATGRWHLQWTVRTTGFGSDSNENIYYAYSDDEGVTWRKTDGTAYSLPITHATGELIVALPGGALETVHGGNAAVDSGGRLHSIWEVDDVGGVARYRHVYYDGSIWHNDLLLPGITSSQREPVMVCFPDGRRWMIFHTGSGGRLGYLRRLDVDTLEEVVLLAYDMLHYFPVVEYSHERNTLYILAPLERVAGALEGDPADLGAQLNVPVLAVQ